MDEARCLAHIARIRAHQERVPDITLLAGIEVDILPDGRLDMADDVLAQLDVVVASLHSHFDLPREAQTERVLRALAHPSMHIWGHPLARHLGKREPVAIDFERVLAAAVDHGVALEINSQPERLDLPDHLLRAAADRGARFVIDTDSHAAAMFRNVDWGVAQARRGWLTAADVLNTRDLAAFRAALKPRRA
jgi:DNA polymerase (family 10)